jgi:hypothetical protein
MSAGAPSLSNIAGEFENVYKGFYESGQRPDWALSPKQLAAQKATNLTGVKSSQQQQESANLARSLGQSETTQYPVALVASREGADAFANALQQMSQQFGAQTSPYTQLGAGAASQWANLLGIPTQQEQRLAQQDRVSASFGSLQDSLGRLGEATDDATRQQLLSEISDQLSQTQGMVSSPSVASQLGNIQQALEATPGYQFRKEQGMKGVMTSLAGRGLRKSGQAMKELIEYNQGMASQEYDKMLGRYAQAAGFGAGILGGTQQLQSGLGTTGEQARLQAAQEFRKGPASMHSTSQQQSTSGGISSGGSKGSTLSFR